MPSQSFDVNPIENMWPELKRFASHLTNLTKFYQLEWSKYYYYYAHVKLVVRHPKSIAKEMYCFGK